MEFDTLKPGDKIYFVNREKSMYLAIIGEKSNPPTGGTIFLNRFKYKSVTSFIASNGCLYQLIVGTKLKRHLTRINQK